MLVYTIYFGFIVSFSILSSFIKKSGGMTFILIFSLVSAAVFSLNSEAPDKYNYQYIYSEIMNLTWGEVYSSAHIHSEIGYKFLNRLFSILFDDFYVFSFLFFFSAAALKLYFFSRFNIQLFYTIPLYASHPMLYQESIQIRTGMAAAFVLISIYYVVYRNLNFVPMILVVIASLIHQSALIVLPCILFFNMTRNVKNTELLVLALFFCAVIFHLADGFNIVITYLKYFDLLPSGVSTYLEWDKYNVNYDLSNLNFIKQCLLLFTALFLFRLRNANNVIPRRLLVIYAFSPILLLSLSDLSILATRCASFFAVIEPIIIAVVAHKLFTRNIALLLVLVYASFIFFYNIERGVFGDGYENYLLW